MVVIIFSGLVLLTIGTFFVIIKRLPPDSPDVKHWIANYEKQCGKFPQYGFENSSLEGIGAISFPAFTFYFFVHRLYNNQVGYAEGLPKGWCSAAKTLLVRAVAMIICIVPFLIPAATLGIDKLGSVITFLFVCIVVPLIGVGVALGGGPYDKLALRFEHSI